MGGERGQAWLASLPRLVAECAGQWSLTLREPCQPSGYTSLTLRATRADGTPCVLKLRCPDEWSQPEGAALRHYGGVAAIALLAEDAGRDALLLERCTPGTSLLTEPDDVATRVVAETVRELWSPPAEGHPFRLLVDNAAPWMAGIAASAAVEPRLRDETLELLTWLAALPPPGDVVLHCDLHPANVLRAERRPWLAIDPIPAVGERAYDLAPVLRDRATPEVIHRRFAIVRDVTGLDPVRLRGWALVQAVEGAAWSYDVGDVTSGEEFVTAANAIAAVPAP
ncbi:MAG TPA: aminoglycoside phosphotransferase family protein [Frankiaceae bacterium]|nr:aminoglycoside phosphotransferase family protein [Frankiaceae bacterium]